MADEADKTEEEKFELDSAGQALVYVSLDQARVLAMDHGLMPAAYSLSLTLPH